MLFNNFVIYFYIRPSNTPGKKGILYLRVTVNGKIILVKAIRNIQLFHHEFNHKLQIPTPDCETGLQCKAFMNAIKEKLNLMHIDLEKKRRVITRAHIINAIPGIANSVDGLLADEIKTFTSAYDDYLEDQRRLIGISISQGTHKCRSYYKNVFTNILKELRYENMPIINYTSEHIQEIQLALLDKYTVGYVHRVMPIVSVIFERAVKKDLITKNPCKEVSRAKGASEDAPIWLEPEELKAITDLELDGPSEKTRDAFVFCCWTGLAIGDYLLMNPKNSAKIIKNSKSPKRMAPATIVNTKEGLLLTGRRRKTGTLYRVPLDEEPKRILNKYAGIEHMPYNLFHPGAELDLLFKMSGIDKPAKFHIARKTFANQLVNERNMNPMYIVDIMGWKNIREANAYCSVKPSSLSKAFFGRKPPFNNL